MVGRDRIAWIPAPRRCVYAYQLSARNRHERAFGINDAGEIAGFYSDAGGNAHGFIYADGAFSTVDVAGAHGTQLIRIKNGGQVTGIYTDALSEIHGLTDE